jgi:ankyrin repeat protein
MILSQDNGSINAVAKLGLTPLILAVGSRQWKVVHILVASGADLSMKDSSGRTAYDIAMAEKAPETVLGLLTLNKPDFKGKATPFSSIVVNESTVTVNLREDA